VNESAGHYYLLRSGVFLPPQPIYGDVKTGRATIEQLSRADGQPAAVNVTVGDYLLDSLRSGPRSPFAEKTERPAKPGEKEAEPGQKPAAKEEKPSEKPRKGDEITVLPKATEDCRVFHAGTKLDGKRLVTNGGRILGVVGRGATLADARVAAYGGAEKISFEGMRYRTDIGYRALEQRKA
jgi:hypothetical protein